MELFELQTKIKTNTLPKFMIFSGEEYAIINIYLEKISKVLGRKLTFINEVSSILSKSKVISLVEPNRLYVCRYDKTFVTNENLWKNIQSTLKDSYLVVVYIDVDKRGKFYKSFSKDIVVFEEQPKETLKSMVRAQIPLNDKNLDILIQGCNNNYSRCLLEIDKIKNYAKSENEDYNNAFEHLFEIGVISNEFTNITFDFVNKVAERDKKCYDIYYKLVLSGESNIKILSLLYTTFRNQLIVQTVTGVTVENTGLTKYAIYQANIRKNKYTNKELNYILDIIMKLEQGIKNGAFEESIVIDYLLAHIL